jgi:Tfp pilus assembly PilM family ATPase
MIYLRSSVGIEVGRDDLVITCLQSNLAAAVFTHFKRIQNFRTREKAEVRREIESFFKSNRLDRESISLGIPRADVVIRHLDLPAEVADNLKQVVQYQVQAFEPTEEEKFYFDYAPLRSSPGAKRISVLLLLVKKSILDGHLSVLQELGIRPALVSIGSIGLANLLFGTIARDHSGKVFVLADLTADGLEISALRGGGLVYSRESVKAGGESWRDLILRELSSAAEKIRLGPEDSIEKIYIAGDGSAEVQRELREELPDCDLLGGRIKFEMPVENRGRLDEASASLGLAYSGMVRRPPVKINLLPAEMRNQQTRWAYVPTVILGLVILALLAALGLRQLT